MTVDLPVWAAVGDDTRGLADFEAALVSPPADAGMARLRAGTGLRVAGLTVDQPLSDLNQRLEGFYRALAEEMGRRWGVPVEFIPGSKDNALDLVAAGQADLAVGVTPRWDGPFDVAYSAPIIAHGDRLMVPTNGLYTTFDDLRGGRWVGIFASEPGAADRVNALATEVNTAVNIFTIINDEDAGYSMVVDLNADVVYGDSLRLEPQIVRYPDQVEMTERWYTRTYNTIGVPRSDPDFRALIEVTLQEMDADGTFAQLWTATMTYGDPVTFARWPGLRGQFLGVNTGADG